MKYEVIGIFSDTQGLLRREIWARSGLETSYIDQGMWSFFYMQFLDDFTPHR